MSPATNMIEPLPWYSPTTDALTKKSWKVVQARLPLCAPCRSMEGLEVQLHLGTRWGWVVDFTSWPLYCRGKTLRYALNRKLTRPRAGKDVLVKRWIPTSAGNSTTESPFRRLDTIHIHYTISWRWYNANPYCFRVIYHTRIRYTADV